VRIVRILSEERFFQLVTIGLFLISAKLTHDGLFMLL
jgi:hypothetical protein